MDSSVEIDFGSSTRCVDLREELFQRLVVRQGASLAQEHGALIRRPQPIFQSGEQKTPGSLDPATRDLSLKVPSRPRRIEQALS